MLRERFAGEGSGHDWWHIYRVWQNARAIGQSEPVDMTVVELAALLHDIADWKFHAGDLEAGPRAAREWLQSLAAEPALIEHVCEIVGTVSFKGAAVPTPMRSREGQVVQDADRLDALGAIGIARAFAYGGSRGRALYDPEQSPEVHHSAEAYRQSQSSTINHFYEKLLLLKNLMYTETARRLASQRHAFMEQFLDRFEREWRGEA
jgi:uncharacterized protein